MASMCVDTHLRRALHFSLFFFLMYARPYNNAVISMHAELCVCNYTESFSFQIAAPHQKDVHQRRDVLFYVCAFRKEK